MRINLCNTSGISDAQFALGQHHFNGGRYHEALSWFEKASGNGGIGSSAQAKYQLGVMYYDGLGVQENPVSSVPHRPINLITGTIYTSGQRVQLHARCSPVKEKERL